MELLIEFLFDLFFEGAEEIAKDPKMPKPLRIAAGSFIVLLILAVVAIVGFLAVILIKENIIASIFFFALDIFFIVAFALKFIKVKKKR